MSLAGPDAPPTAPPPWSPTGRGLDAGDPPPPRRRRPSARMVAAAVAVALVLAGNGAALLLIDRHGDDVTAGEPRSAPPSTTADDQPAAPEPTEPPSTTTAPSTSTTEPRTPLERAVAELSAFVADQRELEFLRPVNVELLDGQAFVGRLLDGSEENRADTEGTEKVLRALQLIGPDVDLFDTFIAFYREAVVGFYDPESDELVLRGSELTPYVRSTLVHELSHALDDQHFELHRPVVDDADDESSLAFSALIEGVSVSIETAYSQSRSDAEQNEAAKEAAAFASRAASAGIPPIVTQLAQFPYIFGPLFVGALVDEGGEERVDAAFREPPTTSEEVLVPSVFLRGEPPVTVPRPFDEGLRVIDEGTYGQWALSLTLDHFLDSETANRASDGWGGDSYVAWDEGAGACVRMAFAMDTPADLSELDSAWRRWADAHGDTTVTRADDLLTVTACG
ncbi:MAG TPA: hypothetical protein VK975_06460 [Acidimicrobiales bacterium]|nr:hypothetical protein [Acidimicrobiales bacterium]